MVSFVVYYFLIIFPLIFRLFLFHSIILIVDSNRRIPSSSLKVRSNHSQSNLFFLANSGATMVEINLTKDEDAYLSGHTIDDRNLFPATGYMVLIWRIIAKSKNTTIEEMPIILEDIVFHRAVILPKEGLVKFAVKFSKASGYFEICEGNALAVSGNVFVPKNVHSEELPLESIEGDISGLPLKTDDIYKELRLRGYDYSGKFRGIRVSDQKSFTGQLHWQCNWVSFIDTMLQFAILGKKERELYLPTRIERAIFNPIKHLKTAADLRSTHAHIPVSMYKNSEVIKSGGIEIRGSKMSLAPRRPNNQAPPFLERYTWVPLQNTSQDLSPRLNRARLHAIAVATQLTCENSSGALKIKVVEAVENRPVPIMMAQTIQTIIENEKLLASDVTIVTEQPIERYVQAIGEVGIRVITKSLNAGPIDRNCHLIVAYDVMPRSNVNIVMENLKLSICKDGFILLEENIANFDEIKANQLAASSNVTIVSIQRVTDKYFILLRPLIDIAMRKKARVLVTETNYAWIEQLQMAMANSEIDNSFVYIVAQGEELVGVVGLFNCLKRENGGKFLRLIFIQDSNAEQFSFNSQMYAEQLSKDLICNVYKNGEWGTFRHLLLNVQGEMLNLRVEHAYVNTLIKGDLSSLAWIEGPLSRQLPDPTDKSIELCTVYYAPINFRDVMLSSGKLAADALPGDLATQDCILGLEFAGRDSTGKRKFLLETFQAGNSNHKNANIPIKTN